MIEKVVAQNGSVVARSQGRLLASAVDPQTEAEGWVDRRETLIREVRAVIVLGAGCGYHITALSRRTESPIVVIEFSREMAEIARSIQNFAAPRVRTVCLQTAKQLRNSPDIRDAINQSFLVLSHPPSVALQPEFYGQCRTGLVGREWRSLTWQWQLKGFSCLDSQPKIGSENTLTIHDLAQTELAQNSSERERMFIKALRELVK